MNDRLLKESDVLREVESLLVSDEKRHLNDLEYGNNHALYRVIDRIEDLPSADRPQGEWIQKPHKVYLPRDCEPPVSKETYNETDHSVIEYWWHCNQCDYEADRWSKPTFNFCPNCGARMKGADDEYDK